MSKSLIKTPAPFILLYCFLFSIIIFPVFYLNIELSLERLFAYPIYRVRSVVSRLHLTYPQVKPAKTYTIVLVGDSMTDVLRLGENNLRSYFKKFYSNKFVNILNYGFGGTNILSLQDRLEKQTKYLETIYPSILDKKPDIILIESFGNNPLSQFPIDLGLKKQEEALDIFMKTVQEGNSGSIIIFMGSIAPNKKKFAEGVLNLTSIQKEKWVYERDAYIKNHIKYAKKHNIPLINIYEKSFDKNGDGDLKYISKYDYIHLSSEGIYFTNKEIANYIIGQRFLPL